MMRILLVLVLVSVAIAAKNGIKPITKEAADDKVDMLPGGEAITDRSFGFSGYLAINGSEANSKKMHYWLVESLSDTPEADPIAFWTNGGPGCSGMIGALTEQGPFRPQADGTLKINPHAWNQKVNMIFIEQPCGVGFSYSTAADTKEDYTADDASAAADNYNLIQAFLQKFPQFQKNDLYLTSESYGGHYIPTLSKVIVDNNKANVGPVRLNFKGFAVGNPATDHYSLSPAMVDTWWGHQLLSKTVYDQFSENECMKLRPKNMQKCEDLFMRANKEVRNLNPYALDFPVCVSESEKKAVAAQTCLHKARKDYRKKHAMHARNARPIRGQVGALLRHTLSHFGEEVLAQMGLGPVPETDKKTGLVVGDAYEPCEDNYASTWINRLEVKQALHVNTDITWSDCSRSIRYSAADREKDMTTYYKYLLDFNKQNPQDAIHMLVYSGDDDSVCGTIGTQHWIYSLGPKVKKSSDWEDWEIDGQTAGFITKFDDKYLGFATVHGAGHEVPTYKPEAALDLFTKFLNKETFSG